MMFAAAVTAFTASAESVFDKDLNLWQKHRPKNIFVDTAVKVAGASSVRLENEATLERYFDLKPDTTYELTFYIKGEKVESGKNNGGRIMLFDGKKKWGRITSLPQNAIETGTFDWRQGKGTINSAQWGSKIRVSLALRGKGKLWFDEVELKEVSSKTK